MEYKIKIALICIQLLKMTAFWDVAPCILVEIDRRFRDDDSPDDGSSKHL
jgi:hypothetical protein